MTRLRLLHLIRVAAVAAAMIAASGLSDAQAQWHGGGGGWHGGGGGGWHGGGGWGWRGGGWGWGGGWGYGFALPPLYYAPPPYYYPPPYYPPPYYPPPGYIRPRVTMRRNMDPMVTEATDPSST